MYPNEYFKHEVKKLEQRRRNISVDPREETLRLKCRLFCLDKEGNKIPSFFTSLGIIKIMQT
jgi:hypothetical protein